MNAPIAHLTIPTWSQGRTGFGQGGWTAASFEAAIGEPVSISLRSGIPLEVELKIVEMTGEHGWLLLDGDTTIMEARPSTVEYASTEPVSVDAARDARTRFPLAIDDHAAPSCFSCGIHPESMQVHPGVLADGTGRFATDWTPPESVGGADGMLATTSIWAPLDCVSGFFVGHGLERRESLTVQFAAEVLSPIRVGQTYVIVAWDGRWPGGWDGRKRGAASCVFTEDGEVVARSDSFWLAVKND